MYQKRLQKCNTCNMIKDTFLMDLDCIELNWIVFVIILHDISSIMIQLVDKLFIMRRVELGSQFSCFRLEGLFLPMRPIWLYGKVANTCEILSSNLIIMLHIFMRLFFCSDTIILRLEITQSLFESRLKFMGCQKHVLLFATPSDLMFVPEMLM